MSLYSQTTTMALWCAQPVVQSVVAIVIWRRKLYKRIPGFLWYLLAQIGIFVVTFPAYGRNNALYFWGYWLGKVLNSLLSFIVIHDIFLDVFSPYHALKDLGTMVFKWAGFVMLLVAVVVAASSSSSQDPLIHAALTLERCIGLVQVGLVLFLILFSGFLGVSRKQVSFGIALGFGMSAGVELMLFSMYSGRIIHHGLLTFGTMAAYNLATLVWLAYSFFPGVARDTGNYLRTQRWEQGLSDLQASTKPVNSLIPMFEGMVERAFSRSSDFDIDEAPVTSPADGDLPRVKSAAAGSKMPR